jgi:hypothetical protein
MDFVSSAVGECHSRELTLRDKNGFEIPLPFRRMSLSGRFPLFLGDGGSFSGGDGLGVGEGGVFEGAVGDLAAGLQSSVGSQRLGEFILALAQLLTSAIREQLTLLDPDRFEIALL